MTDLLHEGDDNLGYIGSTDAQGAEWFLWGISHYFDASTRRFHDSKFLVGHTWASNRGSKLLVARESLPDYTGKRLHRVVIILSEGVMHPYTVRVECATARASAKVYEGICTNIDRPCDVDSIRAYIALLDTAQGGV